MKGGQQHPPPNLGPCIVAKGLHGSLAMGVGLGPGHIVLHGDPAPSPKKGYSSPQFLAHLCCSHMAGWIKMPLGMKVGLDPGHMVLGGDPPPKGAQPPSQFLAHVCCGRMAGWIKMPLSSRPWPHYVRWAPRLPERGTAASRLFNPCLLWANSHPYQLLLSYGLIPSQVIHLANVSEMTYFVSSGT